MVLCLVCTLPKRVSKASNGNSPGNASSHQGTVMHPLNAACKVRKNCWLTMQDCLISVSSEAEGST